MFGKISENLQPSQEIDNAQSQSENSILADSPEVSSTQVVQAADGSSTWKKLLGIGWKIINVILWTLIVLIIIASLGRHLAFVYAIKTNPSPVFGSIITHGDGIIVAKRNKDELVEDLEKALAIAHSAAKEKASRDLDDWIQELMTRVDSPEENQEDFLDWYLSYWNIQEVGFKSVRQKSWNLFQDKVLHMGIAKTVEDLLREDLASELNQRVFRSGESNLKLKNIMLDVAQVYEITLDEEFDRIRIEYNVPKIKWNDYIDSITLNLSDPSIRRVSLDNKLIAALSIGSATTVLAKPIAAIATKMTVKLLPKIALKKGIPLLGGPLAPVAFTALAVWDYVDIKSTASSQRPILKDQIEGIFKEMKKIILEDSIEKAIREIEARAISQVKGSSITIPLPSFSERSLELRTAAKRLSKKES